MPPPRNDTLSTAEIAEKLVDVSGVIERRMGLKPAEYKRVEEAFVLLAKGTVLSESVGSKQRQVYLDFLQRVEKIMNLSMVVLCAAGFGPSAVAAMRDRVRVDLPFHIKEREGAMQKGVLQSLATECLRKCGTSTLTTEKQG